MTKSKRRGKRVSDNVNKDANQRMNFLYQAAHITLSLNPENIELARYYTHTMKTVSSKLLVKLDPSIKRTVCKYCSALLVPGITSTVRVRKKRETHVVTTCLDCGTMKRFNARKNYKLWSEQWESNSLQAQSSPTHTTCSTVNEKRELTNTPSKSVKNDKEISAAKKEIED